MTRDDIIRMAREAGFDTNREMIWINGWEISPYMERFAALVAAAEREACAKVALSIDDQESVNQRSMQKRIVRAIRARGQQ